MSETTQQTQIRLAASQMGMHLWRNNNGACYDQNGRLIRYGLGNDSKRINEQFKSSDLIGIMPVVINQEMVGKTIGIFIAVECKSLDWNYKITTKREIAQQNFIDLVNSQGGLAGFATNNQDLYRIISK